MIMSVAFYLGFCMLVLDGIEVSLSVATRLPIVTRFKTRLFRLVADPG